MEKIDGNDIGPAKKPNPTARIAALLGSVSIFLANRLKRSTNKAIMVRSRYIYIFCFSIRIN